MKRLLLTTALLGLPFSAAAQDQFRAAPDAMEIRATDFIGMRVYATEAAVDAEEYEGLQEGWEDIGEVNDVILGRDGTAQAVLVDIGGFLGLGERQVAVSMGALRFVADSATAEDADDYFLVLNASRAVLEGAPEYAAMGAATADATAGDAAAATEDAATAEAMQETAAEVEAASADTAGSAENTDPAADTAEMTVDEGAAVAGDAVADATGEAAVAATEGETVVIEAEEVPAEGEAMATEEMAAEAPMARTPIEREGYLAAAPEALTADRLQGAAVYDSNDERIGEVSELLMTEDGQVNDVIVDIGGFLGIGEKPVSMAMGDIDILQQDGGDEIRVYVSQTREQLEALPTYEN